MRREEGQKPSPLVSPTGGEGDNLKALTRELGGTGGGGRGGLLLPQDARQGQVGGGVRPDSDEQEEEVAGLSRS